MAPNKSSTILNHVPCTPTLIRQRRWLLNTERTVSAGLRTRGAAAPRRLTNPAVAFVQAVANAPRARACGRRCVLYCTHLPPAFFSPLVLCVRLYVQSGVWA